ncbi:MAG: adenosylmethionine decarboxylase [Methylococcaceae bacterium]|nr:adenosylmethionine decarboxylase [Methylococcaceae bacterium]
MQKFAPVGELAEKFTGQPTRWPTHHERDPDELIKDHFIERNGAVYAGTHLILDLWGAKPLDDLQYMENVFRRAVYSCNATLLHLHLHHFTPNGGISGVAVLAESHISVHTWPERDFAAFDVFMCGRARPEKAIEVFEKAFSPNRIEVVEQIRGRISQ